MTDLERLTTHCEECGFEFFYPHPMSSNEICTNCGSTVNHTKELSFVVKAAVKLTFVFLIITLLTTFIPVISILSGVFTLIFFVLALFAATDNALRPFAVFFHKMHWRIACLFAAPGSKANYWVTYNFVLVWLFIIVPAVGYILVQVSDK